MTGPSPETDPNQTPEPGSAGPEHRMPDPLARLPMLEMALAMVPFVGVLLAAPFIMPLLPGDAGLPRLVVAGLLQIALSGGVLYWFFNRHGMRLESLGLVWPSGKWIGVTVLGFFMVLIGVAISNILVTSLIDEPANQAQMEAFIGLGPLGPGQVLMLLLFVALIIPVIEEIAFRGVIFGWFRWRLTFLPAAIISAAVFAGMHMIVALIPALMIVGVVNAWLYERTGSLVPPIALHGVNNLNAALVLLMLPDL